MILIYGCSFKSEESTSERSVSNKCDYEIDFESSLTQSKEIKLSEISESIEYLPLKTPKDIIITSIREVELTDDFIFVISKGVVFQFGRDGTFIRQVGSKGRGPGEYFVATDMSYDRNNLELVIFGLHKILRYKVNGEFINSVRIRMPVARRDSIIWIGESTPLGIKKQLVIAMTNELDTISVLLNYNLFKHKNGNRIVIIKSKYQKSVYEYENNFYFKGGEDNDTIWKLTLPKPEIHIIINMGKWKLPLEYRADYSSSDFYKNAESYYSIPRLLEDKRYCYLIAQPRLSKQQEYIYYPVIYDKKYKKSYIVRKGSVYGITDDILNGPSFWPFFSSENYLVSAIEAYDLINKLSETKTDYFRSLLSSVDENSNQVLIICHKN